MLKLVARSRVAARVAIATLVICGLAAGGAKLLTGPSSRTIALTDANGFSITGQLSSTNAPIVTPDEFYPGAQRYLVLTVNNPLTVGIYVTSLSVTVVSPLPAGCAVSNLDLGGGTGSQSFTVSLNIPSGGSQPAWLPISLVDTGSSQDGCQGAVFNFAYGGAATYTEVYETSVAVASSQSPSIVGQPVTFTATVTATQGAGQDPVPSSPTGTVTFNDGTTAITGCVNLPLTATPSTTTSTSPNDTQSTATCTPPTYNSAGTRHITAVYTDGTDGNFVGSTSPAFSEVVNPSPTTTALSANPTTSLFGQAVALTATVTPTSGPTPTGTISFYLGTSSSHVLLGTQVLAAGSATLTTNALPGGTDTLYAAYGGSTNDLPSTSSTNSELVGYTSTCFTGTINGGLTVKAGQAICLGAGSTVNGGVTVQSGGALSAFGTTINGGLKATGATGLRVCGSTVNGGLSVTASSGLVMVGDAGEDGTPTCAANTLNGSVTLSSNSRGFELSGNVMNGSVTLSGNTDPGATGEDVAEVEGNTISGSLSCATSNLPSLTDDVRPNTVSGSRSGECVGGF